jgi:hypothetical protein
MMTDNISNNHLAKKYPTLIGIIVAVSLLFIAVMVYPGGSRADKNSVGFDWKNNYISNLFGKTAINGSHNSSRVWAITGMLFLSITFALFFADFSKRIASKGAARVIKYFGIAAMISTFLVVTPYHDTMITIACTLTLVSMFYITVFVFKSNLHFFKIVSVIFLLVFYTAMYIYYSGNFVRLLPIMQKLDLIIVIIWMLSLQFFTDVNDFQPKKIPVQ